MLKMVGYIFILNVVNPQSLKPYNGVESFENIVIFYLLGNTFRRYYAAQIL